MTLPWPEALWMWGPGVFILVIGYFMFSSLAKYLGKHFLEEFLESQKRQAAAIEGLCRAIQSQRHEDDKSAREIIYCIKLVQADMDQIKSSLESVKRKIDMFGAGGKNGAERTSLDTR